MGGWVQCMHEMHCGCGAANRKWKGTSKARGGVAERRDVAPYVRYLAPGGS